MVVAIAGSLDSTTSPQAQQALDAIVTKGGRKVAVDCTALDDISSAGLRVLLGLAKQLGANGGALRMCKLNQTVREVFEISGFSTILPVFFEISGFSTILPVFTEEREALEGF